MEWGGQPSEVAARQPFLFRRSAAEEPRLPATASHRLRIMFAVQGEGRGHMTQALALAEMLRSRGHEIVRVLVGKTSRDDLPEFFREGIRAPISLVPSPAFSMDAAAGVRFGRTLANNLERIPSHLRSIRLIHEHVETEQPDLLINFYEVMLGMWKLRQRSATPVIAVGHQFMFEHPEYPFARGQAIQRTGMKQFTRLVGHGAVRRLALSFYDAEPIPDKRHRIVPPLLRRSVLEKKGDTSDGSLLIYLLKPEMAKAIIRWSDCRPEHLVHCFWDGPTHSHSRSLHFHSLDGESFLSHMDRSRGVVCTAGFESVCEAGWLGKPVFMVPVRGHYEQRCNALDAVRFGLGWSEDHFDLDRFIASLDRHKTGNPEFQRWVGSAERTFVSHVEEVGLGTTRAQAVRNTLAH